MKVAYCDSNWPPAWLPGLLQELPQLIYGECQIHLGTAPM